MSSFFGPSRRVVYYYFFFQFTMNSDFLLLLLVEFYGVLFIKDLLKSLHTVCMVRR